MIFIGLPVCNIEPLIGKVLDCLFENTSNNFVLSVCDNASKDKTVDIIRAKVKEKGYDGNLKRLILSQIPERRPSIECTNQALAPFASMQDLFDLVVKLDHDYGVPKEWDSRILDCFSANPSLRLLSPSVDPSTPKGMQYYSQGHQPEKISFCAGNVLYHYQGIAGYCHCMRPEDFKRERMQYRCLNQGAVFGSEDADWSLRMGGAQSNAYLFNLQGYHWNKDIIGDYEDIWKAEATFLKTRLHFEEWAKTNVPEQIRLQCRL